MLCNNSSKCRQKLFNEIHDDIHYSPLPEDRPGGFNWGEEAAPDNAAAAAEADADE